MFGTQVARKKKVKAAKKKVSQHVFTFAADDIAGKRAQCSGEFWSKILKPKIPNHKTPQTSFIDFKNYKGSTRVQLETRKQTHDGAT